MAAETHKAAAMEDANSEATPAMALAELAALLSPSSPAAPEAAEAALALSGSASGRELLAAHPAALSALAAMASGPSRGARAALAALVNASAEPAALEPLLAALPALLPLLPSSGEACGVLANLSREPRAAPRVLRALGPGAEPLLRALRAARPPGELGALLCNLSQAPEGRRLLLERSGVAVRRLLELVRSPGSAELRRGVLGALRNCCFEHEHHEWLLSEAGADALPSLLLPLAGPEELPEDETEQLPLELQFLPPEQRREEEPEIRRLLLEALLLLAATKGGRNLLRSRGCYFILRELHGWESDPGALGACRNLIQVLIGEEPEAGMENLLEVEIPDGIRRRLEELEREEERELRREKDPEMDPEKGWEKEQEMDPEKREKEQEMDPEKREKEQREWHGKGQWVTGRGQAEARR